MKRILITGGSGHLGQKLIECLSNDHHVCSPSKHECNILKC